MMASPSIVLTFLAVSLDMPIFLVGALVSIRQAASSLTDIFFFDAIARIRNRKRALSLSDMTLAVCFGATIVAVLFGHKLQTMLVFIACVFVMGMVDEFQQLLQTDFISDNLNSRSRITLKYAQMALGGGIAVTLAWLAHELTLDLPPLHRHSIVVAIGVTCFTLSACAVLAVRDFSASVSMREPATRSPIETLSNYISNTVTMMRHSWFRKFIALRLIFAIVVLSVPFFSLISAESHHASNKGLTALIISYAMGYIVAGPLWGALNNVSHWLVMVASALLVAVAGATLAILHIFDIDHDVRDPRCGTLHGDSCRQGNNHCAKPLLHGYRTQGSARERHCGGKIVCPDHDDLPFGNSGCRGTSSGNCLGNHFYHTRQSRYRSRESGRDT